MEFIQCSHCGKKYNVNDKVRSFVGREIKCKACNAKFPIIIHIAPDKTVSEEPKQESTQDKPHTDEELQAIIEKVNESTAGENIETDLDSASPEHDNKNNSEQKTKKRGNQLQLYLTIFLAVCLLAGLSFLLLMENTDPVPKAAQQVILEPLPEFTGEERSEERAADKPEVRKSFSDECKKVAAGQWLIDHNMIHGQLTNDQYMDFMDLSQEQSAKVRQICGDDRVVQQVLQAARNQVKPSWIRSEIRILQE